MTGWDQRGVGLTSPDLSCFQSIEEDHRFWAGTPFRFGIEVKGAFDDQVDLKVLKNQTALLETRLGQLPKRCELTSKFKLQYLGTAATVRDMVALNEAVEGSGSLVNFWGFSYGTLVGSFFVNSE